MRSRGLIWPLAILLGALAARRWTDVVEVRGRSMLPTLHAGDRLLVARLGSPRRADVVLAADPRAPRREMIKRVARIDASGVHLRGDNPAASTDARAFGPVPAASIEWRAVLRYWPPDRIGPIPSAPE